MESDHIRELEHSLNESNARLERAMKALQRKHQGGEWEEYHAALDAVLDLERKLAATRGEPHAIPSDFPVEWDMGAPLPQLLANDHKTFLIFYLREADPDWDGSYVTVVDRSSSEPVSLALVEFKRCLSSKIGSPNDEVFHGHPLYGKGLNGYTAQVVVNSPWVEEIRSNNAVHSGHKPESWKPLKHFVFWFHDSTVECVAESYKVELHRVNLGELLKSVVARMLH